MKSLYLQLITLFFITQVIGLYAGNDLLEEDIHATIISEDKDGIENSVGLFVYILIFTVILLIIIKYASEWVRYLLFKVFETLAIFFSSIIVFASFIESNIVFLIGAAIIVIRNIWFKNIWLRNFTAIVSTAGAGALLGASLGIWPVLVFMVLLSVYDFIAVFKTKHMVKLAKSITQKNLAFTYAMPVKNHTFELGTGDIVLPLTFAVSILGVTRDVYLFPYYWIQPGIILLASLLGLIVTISHSSKNVGKALPALPLQTGLMIFAYVATVLAGF